MIGIRSFHPSRSWRWPRSPSPINGQQRLISSVRLGLDKYERSATKYWNDFYKRHQSKFFKDRHYLEKDWGRFFSDDGENCKSGKGKVVLEVGCGAGNTIFPLITAFPNLFIHACDFSPLAIELVKEHRNFRDDRVNAFVSDVTVDDLSKKISPSSVDVVTLIFTLSSVSPKKMPFILQNIRKVLKPNGYVLLRDYAIGDFAQEKLTGKDRLISENFYVRGDGTCAFYFTEDFLTTLFEMDGFSTVELSMYCKKIENRSRKIVMDRRWIRCNAVSLARIGVIGGCISRRQTPSVVDQQQTRLHEDQIHFHGPVWELVNGGKWEMELEVNELGVTGLLSYIWMGVNVHLKSKYHAWMRVNERNWNALKFFSIFIEIRDAPNQL